VRRRARRVPRKRIRQRLPKARGASYR
jgi:hypothetical protein